MPPIVKIAKAKTPAKAIVRSPKTPRALRVNEAAKPLQAAEAGVILFPFQSGPDAGYRQLSQQPSVRDLFPFAHDEMQRTAYYLYATNNTAARCVEILVDFIVGEGVRVKATDARVQAVLDEFWNDQENNLDELIPQMVQEQSVFGELLLQCYANEISGQVRVALTDPLWIYSVEYATLSGDPYRAVTRPKTVVMRRHPEEPQDKRLAVVRKDDNPYGETYGQLVGECFYWPLKKARAATRGISDLFKGADLFASLDQFIWAVVQQAKNHGAFIWDLLLRGATQEQIDQWIKDHPVGPQSGAVRVHNENTEWKAVSPDLQAGDKSETGRLIRNTIISGFGYPEHWFADGGNVNRATALEMGDPALKMLTRRQRSVKFMLEELLRYVVSAAITAGTLPEDIDTKLEVQMPELSVKDQGKAATALSSTTQALTNGREAGLVDEETAANVIALQIGQMGVDVDASEMLKKARHERAARKQEDWTAAQMPEEPVAEPGEKQKQEPEPDETEDTNG